MMCGCYVDVSLCGCYVDEWRMSLREGGRGGGARATTFAVASLLVTSS